jgi:hypothetical protein
MQKTYDKRFGTGCYPVLLLLDEAGRVKIPQLYEYATTVVGRQMSLWVAIQPTFRTSGLTCGIFCDFSL